VSRNANWREERGNSTHDGVHGARVVLTTGSFEESGTEEFHLNEFMVNAGAEMVKMIGGIYVVCERNGVGAIYRRVGDEGGV
jgi:hypothetical protein